MREELALRINLTEARVQVGKNIKKTSQSLLFLFLFPVYSNPQALYPNKWCCNVVFKRTSSKSMRRGFESNIAQNRNTICEQGNQRLAIEIHYPGKSCEPCRWLMLTLESGKWLSIYYNNMT